MSKYKLVIADTDETIDCALCCFDPECVVGYCDVPDGMECEGGYFVEINDSE
jgi:hypothetical protein